MGNSAEVTMRRPRLRSVAGLIHFPCSRAATSLLLLAAACSGAATAEIKSHPEVPVTAMNLAEKPANNSPMLAVDPTDSRFVALANRLDGPDFSCALQVSGDGGGSWLTANPVSKLPAGADKCYAPEIAFDRTGRLYYLFVGLHGQGNEPMGAFLTTTSDRARTFSAPLQVLEGKNFGVRMALDHSTVKRGRIHLTWLKATSDPPLGGFGPPPNPIMHAFSDDGGRTFSEPAQVSDPERNLVVAPALSVSPDGDVHVLYYDLGNDLRDYHGLEGPPWEGNWSLVMASSRDRGVTFSKGAVVEPEVVPPERVMLIFTMAPASLEAAEGGRVYVGWHDARNGDWDVFVRRSTSGGRTWSTAVRVNDDPVGNGRHQYLPRLAAAPGGRLDVIFYDRRGNIENRGNDVAYAFSRNSGAAFSANRLITTLNFDSRIGPRYDVPSAERLFEFGSRIALIARDKGALAAWTDTRNTGRGAPSQDIFAARVELSPGLEKWVWGGAGTAGAAALALLWAAWNRRRQPNRSAVGDPLSRSQVG